MTRYRLVFILIVMVAALGFGAATPARAQDAGLLARVLAAINADRVANGLAPYALNPLLTLSAQRHSEYQASIGTFTHDEPDGSRALQRAQRVGYPAVWANENVYMGNDTPENVVNWWYTADPAHRENILHKVLREVGIGIASDAQGAIYWTLDISAQPNVLPIFINSGAASTSDPNVILTLTNENVFQGGPGQIGYAGQVMISNSPDFAGATPQLWAQYIHWTLDTSGGEGSKTVYVRSIDTAGRTADSQASIVYQGGAGSAPATIPTNLPAAPPTSAPVIVQPRPQPTAIRPTAAPSTVPTQMVTEAPEASAQPTVDYAVFSAQYRASKASDETTDSAPPAEVLGMETARLRDLLVSVLALGVGLIALGTLALVTSWRRSHPKTPKGEASDGDD